MEFRSHLAQWTSKGEAFPGKASKTEVRESLQDFGNPWVSSHGSLRRSQERNGGLSPKARISGAFGDS